MASSTIEKKAIIEYIRSAIGGNPLTITLQTGGAYVIVGTSSDTSLNFMGLVNVSSYGAVLYTPILASASIGVATSTNSITITNSSNVGSKISLIHLAN